MIIRREWIAPMIVSLVLMGIALGLLLIIALHALDLNGAQQSQPTPESTDGIVLTGMP